MWGYEDADPKKIHSGDQPSNSILMSGLFPRALGMLLAFYEHKVYTQSLIWQINPFDQWGVELGKNISKVILPSLKKGEKPSAQSMQDDSSLLGLIEKYQEES